MSRQIALDNINLKKAERCKGAILATGNHLPANIPDTMMDRYIETLLPRRARS